MGALNRLKRQPRTYCGRMNRKMESIEINIPTTTRTPTKAELHESGSTKSEANASKAWLQIQSVWDFCKEDAGREIFVLKVGLAVLLVSLLILFEASYQVFGPNIVWAIITAVLSSRTLLVCCYTFHAIACKHQN